MRTLHYAWVILLCAFVALLVSNGLTFAGLTVFDEHLLQEFELVDEGSYYTSGPGDGHFLRYRYFSDDGDSTIETKIIVTQGPLLCEMTLTRGRVCTTEPR